MICVSAGPLTDYCYYDQVLITWETLTCLCTRSEPIPVDQTLGVGSASRVDIMSVLFQRLCFNANTTRAIHLKKKVENQSLKPHIFSDMYYQYQLVF